MSTVKKVLEAIKTRRLQEEALETVRAQTKRSVPRAVWYCIMACYFLWIARLRGFTQVIEGKRFLLLEATGFVVCAVIFGICAFRSLYISPKDKLLLLLAEEVLAKKETPIQPPETPSAVVPPPGTPEARQP